MKGSLRVMNRDVIAAARQGTVTWGVPLRTARIRGVASGVLVMAVFNPAHAQIFLPDLNGTDWEYSKSEMRLIANYHSKYSQQLQRVSFWSGDCQISFVCPFRGIACPNRKQVLLINLT